MMENTIYNRFKQIAASQPDAIAIVENGRKITYSQLDSLADAITTLFPKKHAGRVGIVMNHGIEMIASILAVLKSGAAYVPAEPSFPPERIKFMMEEADVDFIIVSPGVKPETGATPLLEIAPGLKAEGNPDNATVAETSPEDTAYILYTSGTTGKPKGVVINNRNVCHYADAFEQEFHTAPGDVMLQYSVCSFDIFVEEVFTTLLNGATLAIPPENTKSNLNELMKFVEAHGVTIISGFPYLLLDMNKLPEIPKSLRLLISGGDVLRGSYIDRLRETGVEIYNTYGPSETTVCATYQRCDNIPPLDDGTFPIGHEIKDVEIMIMNKKMKPVKPGERGEICILGEGVGEGYLTTVPESANFTTLPDGRRIYRSGDLGYRLPDGSIGFLHRKDDQVMILGKRVEREEVENVINAIDDVENGVVEADIDSQGLSYLVAYIVPSHLRFSFRQLTEKLKRKLTPFMIPEFFIRMETLPLTPNGKVDRKALPKVFKEGQL
ncbi:amino acid adenylation domain-containing protein [uncultured Duncaniella sp.]|uniref:amino acid adenylation domain-containing protein n=2 Tax=uncultured Duncaniella sp. TaxID=2768039 RepID=UPI0025CFBDB9|nr:amino acid adenylation domain-containing protein [uncultured Duncaniella sp.]